MLRQYQFHPQPRISPPPEPDAYHEFFQDGFRPRDHYVPMWEHIRHKERQILDAMFREAGHGMDPGGARSVSGAKQVAGSERVWPFDIVPRIITAGEWGAIETGLKQRVRALNLFLKDIYGRQDILKDGVISPELIYRGKDFRREIMDINPPHDIYIHLSGIDLIRDEEGRYLVLEDNLRTLFGISRMIENRIIQRRILPELFHRYRIRRVEHYPRLLLQALRYVSPRSQDQACVVVLTPGDLDPAYFEHVFLAREMDVELVQGRDLVGKNDKLYLKIPHGLRQVDVLYRGVGDDSLDPLVFGHDSPLGVAGMIAAWRAGNLAIVNAPGTGIADDKAVHAHVPDIIRYYLGERPLLENVATYQMTDDQDRDYVLENLERMVVKSVAASGGHGILMGPTSTPAQRRELARKIKQDPRNYIAQPVIRLSRHVCYLDGELESRHQDLRAFVIYGHDIEVFPGCLTRVAREKDSLVVSAPQGGGSKDTWVLAE